MAYAPRQEPSAPHMYPTESIRPVLPVRSEYAQDPQEQALLQSNRPPQPPPRHDKPEVPARNDIEENIDVENYDCSCNYDRYAKTKTMGHIAFILALLMSNLVHLRTLILQKQHDGTWIASLALVCLSIVIQLASLLLFYFACKGDIRNHQHQTRLERLNYFTFVVIIIISVLNFVINILMLSINPQNFLDTRSIELLQRGN